MTYRVDNVSLTAVVSGLGFTYRVDDASLPAVVAVALWHELVHHPRTLQQEDDAPYAERPPAQS